MFGRIKTCNPTEELKSEMLKPSSSPERYPSSSGWSGIGVAATIYPLVEVQTVVWCSGIFEVGRRYSKIKGAGNHLLADPLAELLNIAADVVEKCVATPVTKKHNNIDPIEW
mmetsp:Transcript_16909/g.24081  ORF Transcript_16909/g.24081 Transcript_16909/m.24081 type:complete len:112 (-) Transcript_16909:61-396(-)